MSRFLKLFLSLSIVVFSVKLTAQTPAPKPGVAAGVNFPGMIGPSLSAGRYDFVQFDKAELQKFVAQEVFQRNEKDREYFLKTIADLEASFTKFVEQQYVEPNAMVWLSNQSSGGTKIPAISQSYDPETFELKKDAGEEKVNFAAAINRFNASVIQLRSKITALTSISTAFPSQTIDIKTDAGEAQTVPNYGNMSFDQFANFYGTALDALINYVSNLPYVRSYPDGIDEVLAPNSGKGLTLNTARFRVPMERLAKMLQKIQELRSGTMEAEDASRAFTTFLKKDVINSYLDTYGTSEKWRMQNEAQLRERAQWAKTLADLFYYRDWLRKTYRMPLGLIGIDYDKKTFNADVLFNSTKDLFNFQKEIVFDYAQAARILQNYRMIVTELTRRTTRLTKDGQATRTAEVEGVSGRLENDNSELAMKEAVADRSLVLLAKGTSLITYIAGNRPLADVGLMVMLLLAADAQSEVMIWQGMYDEFNTRYIDRYFDSDADDAIYSVLSERVQNIVSGNEVAAPKTPPYYIYQCSLYFNLNERNLDLAKELFAQYEILRNGGDSSEAALRRKQNAKKVDDEIERRRQQRQQQGK